ncbi:sigma-54 interaction domain-containing protein [Oligosphaera ethanolica]|uniref:PAS domain S-box-containing protein n=1 Tax=Oligosphaera ethanolica TaxID=760260 RepID=A0AAE3VGY8_9BACT|nr:sigma 54-interacting transcriptional regulator [Oligosphaera ethanolica]MDQ0290297.1 PAS domain S-box-containing protein [Oligosphaera ethanolica]
MNRCPDSLTDLDWLSADILLRTIPDGVMVVDARGHIRAWNRMMERLTGLTHDRVCGKPCNILHCNQCGDPRKLPDECPMLRGELDERSIECEIRSADGSFLPVLRNVGVIRDQHGTIKGLVECFTDLRKVKRLEQQLSVLGEKELLHEPPPGLTGRSSAMQDVYRSIHLAAASDATVLLHGETGTGKERVAEAIHHASARRDQPLVRVNCSALSETLLESELFGHVKGAFTGAVQDKPGRFELANGGTIFLDEIGDISLLSQLKLLRVLQERTFERVGDSKPHHVDIRVICATHRDLHQMVLDGQFREDLYYRIRVFPILLPSLRERKGDLPLLVTHFIEHFNRITGRTIAGVDNEALHCLMDYCWPGNVRELENAIEHAFVTCRDKLIGLFDLPMELRMVELRHAYCPDKQRLAKTTNNAADHPRLDDAKSNAMPDSPEAFKALLAECGGNRSKLARRLGVDRTTIWRRMKQLGL